MQKLLDYPNYTKLKVHMYLHMYIYSLMFNADKCTVFNLLPDLKIKGEILWEYIIL